MPLTTPPCFQTRKFYFIYADGVLANCILLNGLHHLSLKSHHVLSFRIPLLGFLLCGFLLLLLFFAEFCSVSFNDFIINFLITILHAVLLFSSLSLNVVQTHPQVPKQQARVNIL